MPTTRPQTPAASSDTFSDSGSLSDLESGWTDISSNRSARRSFSAHSDAEDSIDTKSLVDRLDGENWDGSISEPEEINIDIDDNILVNGGSPSPFSREPNPAAHHTQSNMNSLTAVRSQSDSVISTTPNGSVCGSKATLQLAFPDPLTSSNEDIFPAAFQTTSPPNLNVGFTKSQVPHVLESSQESTVSTEFLSPDKPLIPPEFNIEDFAEAIILLGKPTADSLKVAVLERIMATKASFLRGSFSVVYDNGVSIIYEIQTSSSQGAHSKLLILIIDLTPQMEMRATLKSLKCSILALNFDRVQPFPPTNLNKNVVHLTLLPPSDDIVHSSISDMCISDSMRYLLINDASPSSKSSLKILNEQYPNDSLGYSELIPIHDFLALSNEAMEEMLNLPTIYSALGVLSHSSTAPAKPLRFSFRAFLFSLPLVLTLAIFMWGNLVHFWPVRQNVIIPPSKHVTPVDQSVDIKGIMTISPVALKSLAVSVFRPQSNNAGREPSITAQCRLSGFTATLPDPRPIRLTLDPPPTKSLALVPSDRARSIHRTESALPLPHVPQTFNALAFRFTTALSPIMTAIEQDINELLEAIDALLETISRLQAAATYKVNQRVDMVHALSQHVIMEVISWSRQTSLSRISRQTSFRAHKYASQRVHAFTNKIYDAALTAGKHVAHRHTRAKQNARNVRNRMENGMRRVEQIFNEAKDKDKKFGDIFLHK